MSRKVPKWIAGMIAMFSGTVSHADTNSGPFGTPLSDFKQTSGLFSFFHFVEVEREDLPVRQKLISFKPSGDAFHELVTLKITTDDQDKIQLLSLTVARSFIDDRKKTIFAADLVKSYLGYAVSPLENDPIDALAHEISARAVMTSSVPILTAQPMPTVRGLRSAAYEIYAGKSGEVTLLNQAGSIRITLHNESRGETPAVILVMSAKSRH